jgi:nicotinamidase-related amidase
MAVPRLDVKHTALMVVDVQEKLLPHMHDSAGVLAQTGRLLDGANLLKLPVLVTEQYRKGLGVTVPELAPRIAQARGIYEKLTFSALIEPVRQALDEVQARTVLVCGIETHVCVLQTCLDLAKEGFIPFIVTDAVSSRRPSDHTAAIQRLIQAQVVPTTVESALLEMVHDAGSSTFKAMLPIIK